MSTNLNSNPGAAAPPSGLDARTPLLLLPVHLETRFVDSPAGLSELWVRIYPDQISINTHEPELTAQEIADGKVYWNAVWRAGNPPPVLEAVKAPWRGLASRYEPERAAWIALKMTPNNVGDQPAAPTPDGVDPVPPPDFPSPPTRDSSWEKAAIAAALPDRWTVVTFTGNQAKAFQGGPVTPDLAVGLTPHLGDFPPGQPVDGPMTWLVDFDEAVKNGMALKIPLDANERARGFDRVFVYGTRTVKPPGGEAFGALLDAHHYTDGFSLVPQGTPTNNTTDAASGYARRDDTFEFSFATERQGALTSNPAGDGNVFAALVGIKATLVDHAGYSDGINALSGADMLTAVWPATLGYFLTQMMADVFTPEQVDATRQYILANAIPRGPVPAFRIGQTPYGVLPVTSLQRYNQGQFGVGSIEPAIVDLVKKLSPVWLASSNTAPHMQRTGDPDKELIGLLGMDASSMTFRGRQVFGDFFIWNYLNFLGPSPATINQWFQQHLVRGRQLLDAFGFQSMDPRVIHTGLASNGAPVPFPTVQAGPLSETDQLTADADLGGGVKANYIQWLVSASVEDIQAENYPGPKPTSLLYKILRQSLILDYADLASKAEIAVGRIQLSQLREAEIIAVPQPPPSPQAPPAAQPPPLSAWEILARPSTVNAEVSWAEFLVNLDPPPESPFARLTEVRNSLNRLAGLSTAELDRLLTETLDACSHRLDVWASAIANALLHRTRSGENSGIHLGAYGWVEEVRPAAQRPPVTGADLEGVRVMDQLRARRIDRNVALPIPVEPLDDNGGFIYAPSFAQAATAAVLRNGYMTHKDTPEEGLLSLDVSSDRVRKALQLLSGVRQGQSLNALLGYVFEQGLHDRSLDQFAQPFRDRFPVIANKLTPSSEPSESVAASNVVDGVALRAAFDNNAFPVGGNWGPGMPAPGSAAQTQVFDVFQLLEDYADALSDVGVAEAVFQIMRGNFGRAGGLMDAISKGDRPPDPDVVVTPRGGLDLTHRVLVLLSGNPAISPLWAGITPTPRALAEPGLNAWVSTLLPDPAVVRCDVTFHDGAGNHTVPIQLSTLGVGPLDCIAMSDTADIPQRSEVEQRVLFAAAIPPGADGALINYHPAGAPPGSIAFPDFFFLAKQVRSLIGGARPLAIQDLTVPEKHAEDQGGAPNLADLRNRATNAAGNLDTDIINLQNAAAGLPGNSDPVRAALLRASLYGVEGSIPLTSGGPDPALANQAATVLKTLQARQAKAGAVNIPAASLDDLLGVFQTIFGDLTVLPKLTPPDIASLQAAFSQSSALTASDAAAPARWFQQLTYVRPAISRLDMAGSLSQLLGGAGTLSAAPLLGQIPQSPGDRWLALPIDPANPPLKGRVAFACVSMGNPAVDTTYAGLIIDEWLERIPSTQEQASVAFHFNEPDARAPQSLLLAVCPDNRATWDDDLILGTLQETLDLAKVRTVDLDSIQQVGQILPALYFPFNLRGATVGSNYTVLKDIHLVATSIRQ
jgi:hypothetical protein